MVKRIGIDAGGSLIKVAYEERGQMHVKTYSNEEMDRLLNWLQVISPDAVLYLTGGKSGYLRSVVKQSNHQVDEFEATAEGTRFLLKQEKNIFDDDFILVSIGTGTSIFSVTKQAHERLLGSGIGGGTLMGLGHLITGKSDFPELVNLAKEGSYANSDLLVKDIYAPNKPPISGDLTAANFGKAHLNKEATEADHMESLVKLIGETLILLSTQAAATQQVEKIVFIGSTLNGNEPLNNVLNGFQDMLPYEPIFLEKGAYAGAIGALMV
ncbi:type II pantothenate kinase [Virgibacillus natechei]|uniref:Type II pantothenate kinase n=1 Tax=Virgibacillus natechei TaxID=1216297 RepID=A0ABS4IL39_9BACI|nr:type II pantothenate kinase [Virgibacillus natechei]MBP1971126.1 type II pantothenate kinase [Virgibacillus natechei]UZD12188.1 type II pantothenate kinase [Virgibacillus natechei]